MESFRRFFRRLLKCLACAGDVEEDNVHPYTPARRSNMLELAPCRRFACTASNPDIELYMYEPRSSIPNALRNEESARRHRQLAAFRELYHRELDYRLTALDRRPRFKSSSSPTGLKQESILRHAPDVKMDA